MRWLVILIVLDGCGDDCGPHGAPDVGLVASGTGVTMTFGHLTSSPNNDCPDPAAPDGVIALRVMGAQTDGTGIVSFCIPRIDTLSSGSLGTFQSSAPIRVTEVTGTSNACSFAFDASQPPTGQGSAHGACDAGTNAKGFALELDGTVALTRTCDAMVDQVSATLRGTVAVVPIM
jgi:hypothetical protein